MKLTTRHHKQNWPRQQKQREIGTGHYATSNRSCRNKADKKEKEPTKTSIKTDDGPDFPKKEKQVMSDAKNHKVTEVS